MRDVFVGTLILVGVLLACYRTPRRRDHIIAIITGMAGVCIGLYPMDPIFPQNIRDQWLMPDDGRLYLMDHYFPHGRLGIHGFAVAIFFGLGIFLVADSFRHTSKFNAYGQAIVGKQKEKRDIIYFACAGLMAASGLAILVLNFLSKRNEDLHLGDYIFFPESLAISSFAFAWLVKGQLIYKDSAPDTPQEHRREMMSLIGLIALPVSLFLVGWYFTARGANIQ